jgi:predicted glycoside hydrolase/deacetylase ChbG (UPF0249 family)
VTRSRPGERRLIINADDLGLHPLIDAGILRCHREGIVTSVSICASGAHFVEAAAGARDAGLDVGVHLTLVGEAPVSSPDALPTLAPKGRLPGGYAALFRRLLFGQVRIAEIEHELNAQVARVRDAGLEVSHLDSHQHVHLHPSLLPVTFRVARRFGIRALRAAPSVDALVGLRPAVLALFAHRAARRALQEGMKVPDAVLGLAETGGLSEERLLRVLDRLPTGTSELVCHPGAGDAAIGTAYGWHFHWDDEARALTSARVRESLERHGVRLVRYRDL